MTRRFLYVVLTVWLCLSAGMPLCAAPRIVNFVNFIRQNDYRVKGSEALLFEATERELELLRQYNLPGTFLLQYDALIDVRYQKLLTERLDSRSEVGAWWEITQPHVEAAGLKWRGDHPWVSTANVGFATGYTQEERRRLVDVYMAKFKEVFGDYPKSVGSWYIDAYTLQYMYDNYHIVASCNCRDQLGTDGYTLWGGYWNQAYYPSKKNGYMPAQTEEGQVPVPVFRMLGSDPIYQYDSGLGDNGQGVVTLEPVYGASGADRHWVECYFDAVANQPCLAFNYTQAGQENSFTWAEIRKGLEMQVPYIADLYRAGKITVQTLKESGTWFARQFRVTPPTAITAVKDNTGNGKQTVWFNSRHYRANILMEKDGELRFRDIHLFDETMPSDYIDRPGQTSHFSFFTPPLVDGFQWSDKNTLAGLRFVELDGQGRAQNIRFSKMQVLEKGKRRLVVKLTDMQGTVFTVGFMEKGISVTSAMKTSWALELTTAAVDLPFTQVGQQRMEAVFLNHPYHVSLRKATFVQPMAGQQFVFRIQPQGGTLYMDCSNS